MCDECNSYFGAYHDQPPIETVIKETFNITRARLLAAENEVGKNKALPRFKSIYFKVDFDRHKISIKPAYKYRPDFQKQIGRQMKRGLYKIFLEETERQYGNGHGHESKFDFIREFARYNIGEYPVFYFTRQFGAILTSQEWVKNPDLKFGENKPFDYLVEHPSFVEFEFLGHVISLAIDRNWQTKFDEYSLMTKKSKERFFKHFKYVENFNDIDLSLSILDDK